MADVEGSATPLDLAGLLSELLEAALGVDRQPPQVVMLSALRSLQRALGAVFLGLAIREHPTEFSQAVAIDPGGAELRLPLPAGTGNLEVIAWGQAALPGAKEWHAETLKLDEGFGAPDFVWRRPTNFAPTRACSCGSQITSGDPLAGVVRRPVIRRAADRHPPPLSPRNRLDLRSLATQRSGAADSRGRTNSGALVVGGAVPMAILAAVARPLAVIADAALRGALAQRQARRFEVLGRLSEVVSGTMDVDALMQRTADVVRELLACEFVGVGLLDEGGEVVLRAVSSVSPVELVIGHRQPLGVGVTGEAVRRGGPVLVRDVGKHPNYVSTGPLIRSEICCPLDVGDGPFGYLDVGGAGAEELDEGHLELVAAIARHLSRAIRNAQDARTRDLQRDELMMMVVHDLRNPATVLTFTLDLIGRAMATRPADRDDPLPKIVRDGREACDEMLSLIDAILSLQKSDSGRLQLALAEVVSAEAVPRLVGRMSASATARGIEVSCVVGEDVPVLRADPSLMTRVLENLLSNAIKHSPRGGRVVVSVERARAPLLRERLPGAAAGVLVSVRDSGAGIPKDDQERIFEKFGVIGGRRAGRYSTGLGLVFSRRAVQAHGGVIWVESAVGVGSTFHILLPAGSTQVGV